ncbi:unnamed protein product [Amaranthus hypochondriacus]
MAGGASRSKTISGHESQRSISPGRPIPKRGQVKGRIVKGLAHSVVSILSFGAPSQHR